MILVTNSHREGESLQPVLFVVRGGGGDPSATDKVWLKTVTGINVQRFHCWKMYGVRSILLCTNCMPLDQLAINGRRYLNTVAENSET